MPVVDSGWLPQALCTKRSSLPLPSTLRERLHLDARIRLGRRMTQLQRADVGGNRPPVLHRNLLRISRHRPPTVRHDIKEMAHRSIAQGLRIVGRRLLVAATYDHSVPRSGRAVTHRTENLVTLLPARDYFGCDRERERVDVIGKHIAAAATAAALRARRRAGVRRRCRCQRARRGGSVRAAAATTTATRAAGRLLARVEMRVLAQVAARHCAVNQRARRQTVLEELARFVCLVARLILHVLTTGGEEKQAAGRSE